MYLKRLKMRNFKSFAGTTEIPFEPGFTGVAGPNGMGKSNISDAILFVLGPTSSKALRADRLTHLFFNGGSSKKPATECEVSLVFDNTDHHLPVEAEEVEVTRYVKLAPSNPDGYYSYFYVNHKRTTQAEIDSLLAHARLAGDGYNLVQQGDVNKIVSMGPVPRRQLLERLAGIAQYDDELARAAAKRAELDSNLSRIDTLLGEIRSRLKGLEAQRLEALHFQQLNDQRRRIEARLARAGFRAAQEEVKSSEAQVERIQQELRELEATRNELIARKEKLQQELADVEREIAEAGGPAAQKFQEELNSRRLAVARAEADVQRLTEDVETLAQSLAAAEADVVAIEREAEAAREKESTLARELKTIEARLKEQTEAIRTATGDSSKGKLAEARKRVLELERVQGERRARWQSAVEAREAAKAAVEAAERTLAIAEDDRRAREVEVRDLELRRRELDGAKSKGGRSTGELQQELFQLRKKEESLTAEATRLGQEVLELNRRYLALEARLKARTESLGKPGLQTAVDFLLSQRNLGKIPGIRGTVEELATFEPEHRVALEVAAGSRFQALVVETDEVAQRCIQLLQSEKQGRATFLPLNRMLAGRPHGKALIASKADGSRGFALDLVRFDEELRPAFWYVFGETVVMDNLEHARAQMGGVRLVTLDGALIEATGAMTGGFVDPSRKGRGQDNPLELKRIGDALRAKTEAEQAAKQALAALTQEIQRLSEELARRSIEDSKSDTLRQSADHELAQARQRLKEVVERIRSSEAAKAAAEKEFSAADESVRSLAAELADLENQIGQAREGYLGQLPDAVSSRLRSLQEALQATTEERTKRTGELEGIRASLAALERSLAERREAESRAKSASVEKQKELGRRRKELAQATSALDAVRGVEAKQSEAMRAQNERRQRVNQQLITVTGELGRHEEALRSRQDILIKEEARAAEARRHAEEIEATLRELPPAAPDEPEVSVDELRRSLQSVTAEIASLGNVNLKAVEEFDAEKQRSDEFEGEVTRLTHEKEELVHLVAEIETKKREKLSEVVVRVNEGFREIYQELSGGGQGEIVLENPADPLAGGLLIRASPTGKVVQRLEQLSGGEKSLASLAFIFALQRYDPSPLYVFDEVDMSLDGLNSEYVGRMLRRNAARAQFIVISLRKVTLKFAHHLYGVTMRGDGCSRIVGLSLDEIRDVDERDGAKSVPVPSAAPLEAR